MPLVDITIMDRHRPMARMEDSAPTPLTTPMRKVVINLTLPEVLAAARTLPTSLATWAVHACFSSRIWDISPCPYSLLKLRDASSMDA